MSNSDLALLYKEKDQVAIPTHNDPVTVVMVTYNKHKYIRELILSFEHLNYDRKLLNIIVIDNASADGSEEKLRAEFGDAITVIQTGANLGGAGGFNTGMRYAIEKLGNDYIWLLDNDVVVHPNSLNWLMDTIKKNPDAAAAGSMILQLDKPELISEIGAFMDWGKARVDMQNAGENFTKITDDLLQERKVEYCAAASLLKTRKSITKLGYWDDLFIHFDDVDWCLRAPKQGMAIYCNPRSIVFHESLQCKQATWIKYYNIRNLLYLYLRHKPLALPLVLAKFGAWSVYLFLHGYYSNAGLGFKAICDFFRGKKAQQEFPLEKYQSMDKFEAKDRIYIFLNQENLDQFLDLTGLEINENSKTILYSDGLVKAITQQLDIFFDKRELIMDGAFESSFFFPCFKKKLVVYPGYNTMVDKS
ncbi:MAG: glycosyltransferase family 2 protein [Cyanobacteria bacterium]|nr:glycosyltransferase family 2 protein [Cyanobacteriota bacterium]MDA1020483.1 glycosyltransferase family 2 protein [Cyanobacteriota bacterium]